MLAEFSNVVMRLNRSGSTPAHARRLCTAVRGNIGIVVSTSV